MSISWNYPTSILVGEDTSKEIKNILKSLHFKKPLLLTDRNLQNMDVIVNFRKYLDGVDYAFFAGVDGNPTESNVLNGIKIFNEANCDSVIIVGGGSALDAGKTIACIAKQTCSVFDLEDVGDNYKRANNNLICPTIAFPTTAGTGSEVGRAAVIVDEKTHDKKIIFHPKMMPIQVVLDAKLTLGLPANLTAWTGIDALTHAIEPYCAPGFHPMADGIAIEAIKLIKDNLQIAYKDGNNVQARSNMLVASMMAATAFQKGLGSVHSLAHPLGAMYNKHHGLLNAIILPYALIQNRSAIEDKLTFIAKYLNLKNQSYEGFLQWIYDFRALFDIPKTLSEIGIDTSEANIVSHKAFLDPSTGGNAKTINEDDLHQLFISATTGDTNNL